MTQDMFEDCTLDQTGRINQISTTLNGNPKTLASSITYLPYGGITGLTYGNGLFLTQGYDNQYRISSIVTGSILNLAFGYDANGNITSKTNPDPPGSQVLEPPGVYTYQTGTNKLIHIEGTPPIDYGYDANANITFETGWTYQYDLSNQLIRVLQNSNQVAEYTYNGAGQRIKKVTQTETRIFHYDLRGHLIAETNQTGQMLAEHIYLGDQLLSMIKPGESVYYFHNDHLGTPQVLTDDSQAIAWKAVYTPFGDAVTSIATVENPFRFPGQYYDQETVLHYNYFRYYNPQTGRYITPDPIGLEGGINLFAYVEGNPVRWVDPEGLSFLEWLKNRYRKSQERMEEDEKRFEEFLKANPNMPDPRELAKDMVLGTGGISKGVCKIASEKTAKNIAKQIERDLGKEARRAFHDMKKFGDRTLQELKDDARYLYEQAGKNIPSWLKK